jgi:hypothetical protein
MSALASKWASHQRIADQTLTTVLRAVAFLADKGTGECRKSQARIAAETGLTERAVRAALVVMERIEIIARAPRNMGRYGRTSDLITLSLGRNFDVSKAAVQAIRKSLKRPVPPESRSAGSEVSHRNQIPLPPEPDSGPYNTGDTEVPYQVRNSSEVEGYSSASEDAHPHDRETATAKVITLPVRGAA